MFILLQMRVCVAVSVTSTWGNSINFSSDLREKENYREIGVKEKEEMSEGWDAGLVCKKY